MPSPVPNPPPSLSSVLTLHPPPNAQPPTTALLLLHGLGDTPAPFATLARSLSLPSTLCIALRAPHPMPFDLGGFHWGDDILFDERSGAMDFDAGFEKALGLVESVLDWLCGPLPGGGGGGGGKGTPEESGKEELEEKGCGFRPGEVVLLGYGQGGMVALGLAQSLARRRRRRGDALLGGAISIGGPMPTLTGGASSGMKEEEKKKKKSATPVLVCGGKEKSVVTTAALAKVREGFASVEYVRWEREGDAMPRNREEMVPVMRFLAGNLRARMRAPEGWAEVGEGREEG